MIGPLFFNPEERRRGMSPLDQFLVGVLIGFWLYNMLMDKRKGKNHGRKKQ